MRVSIITVSHRSSRKLEDYVASFLKTNSNAKEWIEFVIIENSGDDSIKLVLEPLMKAGFSVQIFLTSNKGFGAGCNYGALNAKGDLLAFVNPDVTFVTSLCPLCDFKFSWGTVLQRRESGEVYSIDRLPEMRSIFYELSNGHRQEQKDYDPTKVFAVGSCLLVNRLLFNQIGGFDERFFLYYEEAELGRRLFLEYGPLFIEKSVEIIHHAFGSYDQHISSFPHEANGLLMYSKVVEHPEIVWRRLIVLTLLSPFSKVARQRLTILTSKYGGFNYEVLM